MWLSSPILFKYTINQVCRRATCSVIESRVLCLRRFVVEQFNTSSREYMSHRLAGLFSMSYSIDVTKLRIHGGVD